MKTHVTIRDRSRVEDIMTIYAEVTGSYTMILKQDGKLPFQKYLLNNINRFS